MEDNLRTNNTFHRFTWTIQNLSERITKELRSKSFEVGSCKWRIVVNQVERNREQYLRVILRVAKTLFPLRWRKFARIKLILINQTDRNISIVRETQQRFNAGYKAWGTPFVHLNEFYNPMRGYLVNNTCIIEAELYISDDPFNPQDNNVAQTLGFPTNMEETTQLGDQGIDSSDDTLSFTSLESTWNHASQTHLEFQEMEDQVSVGPSNETKSPTQVCSVPGARPSYPATDDELEEVPLSPALSEIIDLRSLEAEDLAFVPLLEEVCSWKPSLIESQRRRTSRFIRWAFIALGRVLYFLKTMKVRNMGDEGTCRKLQGMWEELQMFGFELTWLEVPVQSALGMKAYLERAEQVRTLKEKVTDLEIEMKKLRENLAFAEVNLDTERQHLAEEEKGFEEIDMDAQLGYGIF
ncbi:MATH domain and coiled-coil domain-containing protein At3g58270-like [Neltuma alba]|uniref:MATH domain and coiled-coil domain-containing protein At3g58270-like n=1 Tax=Neltuma alba TaxID=207710 RepID=UPI0010A58108|nr:MATH domain and coiled-coil domain-containing protein At3g58270-like [Prosopis alba]